MSLIFCEILCFRHSISINQRKKSSHWMIIPFHWDFYDSDVQPECLVSWAFFGPGE